MSVPPTKPEPQRQTGCAMLVPGYGILRLHAQAVAFGISIVANESESRHRKAMYVTAKTSGSFNLSLAFYTHHEYAEFGRIMLHYGNNLTRGIVGSPCRVMIPSLLDSKTGKPFDRNGIPRSGVPFGERVGELVPKVTLSFIGTSDPYSPVGVRDVGLVSNVIGREYLGAIKKDPMAAYYYPSGSQLSGSNYGVDTLYDSVPGDALFQEAVPTGGTVEGNRANPGTNSRASEF